MYVAIWKSKNDQYYFEICGENHKTMAVSETYVRKASAEHAIEVIKEGAAGGRILDLSSGTKYARRLP